MIDVLLNGFHLAPYMAAAVIAVLFAFSGVEGRGR